jgi:hypothetical protein
VYEDDARNGVAGGSSGTCAAKILRKHARISSVAPQPSAPRALLQIFHPKHAELPLNWRCVAQLRSLVSLLQAF